MLFSGCIRALASLPSFFVPLLLLLLVFSPLAHADPLLLYNGSLYAPPSLAAVPLRASLTPFWISPYWSSAWILSDSPRLYHLDSLQAPQSLQLDAWRPGSVSSASALGGARDSESIALASARSQALLAKSAYTQTANLSVRMRAQIDVGQLSICFISAWSSPATLTRSTCLRKQYDAVLSTLLASILNVPNQYAQAWNQTLLAGTRSLANASLAADLAFAQAEQEADALAQAGGADPLYDGAARPAWAEWAAFAYEAERYARRSDLPLPSDLDLADQPALRYARAYRVLHGIESTCAVPADPVRFDTTGSPALVFNDLAGSGEETLIAHAHALESRLSSARAQLEFESTAAQTQAQANLSRAQLLSSVLEKADWSADYTLPTRALADVQADGAWDRVGSYDDRLARAADDLALAKTSHAAAQSLRADKPGFWASQALRLDLNASAYADSSTRALAHLLEDLNQSTRTTCAQALERAQTLNHSLLASASNASAPSARLARVWLSNATTQLQSADAQAPARLGPRYAHCHSALVSADTGLRLLAANDSLAIDLGEVKRLLANLSARIQWARALGVDTAEFSNAYTQFYAQYCDARIDGSGEAIRAQIQSLDAQMDAALVPERERADALQAAALALQPYRSDSLARWRAEIDVWRSSDGGWSDAAYQKPASLRTQLSKSEARTHVQLAGVLGQALCAQAHWTADSQVPWRVGASQSVGGRWTSANPLALNYSDALDIDCPLALSFLASEVSDRSEGIQSASASEGQLHLRLTHVEALDSLHVQVSSTQIPYTARALSCNLSVRPGTLEERALYQLRGLYPASALEWRLPWSSRWPPTLARLAASGLSYEGQPSIDEADSLAFLLSSPPLSSNWSALITSPYSDLARESPTLSAASGGRVEVGYRLDLSDLPACSTLFIEQDEPTDAISNLSVRALDRSVGVTLLQSPQSGQPIWRAQITSPPASGPLQLAVHYLVEDPAAWVDLRLPVLREQARVQSDGVAQDLIERAASSAQSQDWPMALSLLEQARVQLQSGAPSTADAATLATWNRTREDGQSALDALTRLSNRLRTSSSRPSWAADPPAWRSSLNASLSDALLASAPSAAQVRALQSATLKARSKSLELADSSYTTLSKRAQSLRTLAPASDETLVPPLASVDAALLAVRTHLQAEQGLEALDSAFVALEALDAGESALRASQLRQARDQSESIQSLATQLALTQSDLSTYQQSLATLDAATSRAYTPLLSASASKTLSEQLTRAAQSLPASDNFSLPADLSSASAQLASRAAKLEAANQTLERSRSTLNAAASGLEAAARSRWRMAQAYVDQLNTSALIGLPATATLRADLSEMQSQLEADDWPSVIVSGESILTRSKKLIAAEPASSAQPPYAILALTGLLILGIGYVLLRGKPPKEKRHAQLAPKTLERFAQS